MKKYKKVKRDKAFVGAAAAGIQATATLAAAGIGAAAQYSAAKQQAEATRTAADIQAAALKQQNESANRLQQRNIDFTKQENELNRDLQKDVQMNLQMLTAQNNAATVGEARRIQVKKGGSTRRCADKGLRGQSFIQAGSNMPFRVTDGGGVVSLGFTPEGYALYEIQGNDHEHYHKAQGGKYKSGVGIKFANGEIIEGEGNQNGNLGELLLVTPNDAKFISKHSIKGFNPTKAVLSGMHPKEAFDIQENIKAAYGIDDAGTNTSSTPVKKMKQRIALNGTMLSQPFMMGITPNLSTDTIAPTVVGVGYNFLNNSDDTNKLAKCGKRVKRPLGGGNSWIPFGHPLWAVNQRRNLDYTIPTTINNGSNLGSFGNTKPNNYSLGVDTTLKGTYNNTPSSANTPSPANPSFWDNYGGSIVNAGANLIGAGITSWGNWAANRHMQSAYNDAANAMKDAYRQMRGIDMSAISRDDFRAAHAMAAIQAPVVATGVERTAAERALHRGLNNIRRGTLSSAAAQDRSNRLNVAYQDQVGQIESNANKIRQGINQENLQRITDVSKLNAQLDTEANSKYAANYLDLLKYNNQIDNTKLMGIADAESNRVMGRAQSVAQTHAANAQGWASAITNSANTFNNNMNVLNQNRYNQTNTMLGATDDGVFRQVMGGFGDANVNARQAYGLWSRWADDTKGIYSNRRAQLYNKYYNTWKKLGLI